MAQTFQTGLFTSVPARGTKSAVPQSALGAISKATTLQDENVFDSITQPLRQRKRRKIAQELNQQGITPEDPAYFSTFRDKLIEFGDQEGAEMVEAKRVEYEQRNIKNAQTQSLIDRRGTQNEVDRGKLGLAERNTDIKELDTTSKIEKREADIQKDLANLDLAEQRLGILAQNANTAQSRLAIEQQRVNLQRARDEINGELVQARTKKLELENDFFNKRGYLPGRAGANAAGKKVAATNAKLSQAKSLISQLDERLVGAAKKDNNFLPGIPGDEVSGIEGWMRRTFGGVVAQVNPDLDIAKGADLQEQGYQYLQSLLVPILLNEKRVTDQDRERVERMTGNLSPGKNNAQNRRILKQLEVFIDQMPDLAPGEFNEGMGPDEADTSAQDIPDGPPLQYPNARRADDGFWYIPNPDKPGKYLKVIP